MNITATVAAGAAGVLAGMVLGVHADVAQGSTVQQQRPPLPVWMKTPCKTEDSWNCYWNDGGGRAFFVRRMPHTNTLCYLYAKGSDPRTDQCIRRARGL